MSRSKDDEKTYGIWDISGREKNNQGLAGELLDDL